MAETSNNKIRSILTNTGIVLLTTFLVVVALEFIFRFFYADQTVLFPRYHTDVQYGSFTIRRIRPNSVFRHKSVDGSWKFTTNKQGFRSYKDFEYVKPPGVTRVLLLGDSHTQGYEVRQDYTFAAIIEKYLLQKNYQVEVLNTGVSGFSTAEELIFLENEGIKYQPDFVVLGFFRNDFEDNLKSGLFDLDKQGELVVVKNEHIPGVKIQNLIYAIPGSQWLSENSYLYSFAFNTTWQFFKSLLQSKSREQTFEYAVATKSTVSEYQLELTSKLIERIHQVCSRIGAKLIIIDIPPLLRNNELSLLPPAITSTMNTHSEAYIDSRLLFSEYAGVAELHVPRGHFHISEFTHTLIGRETAAQIVSLFDNTAPQ